MSTIVLRNTKGSPLTWQEGDDNFNNLNTDKIEAVVDDSAPQLGGNLDVNDHNIVSGANNQIRLSAAGADMVFENQEIAPGVFASVMRADNQQYVTAVTGGTSLLASANTGSISVEYGDGTSGPINIKPGGSGQINMLLDDDGTTGGKYIGTFSKQDITGQYLSGTFDDYLIDGAYPAFELSIYDQDLQSNAAFALFSKSVNLTTDHGSNIRLSEGDGANIYIQPSAAGKVKIRVKHTDSGLLEAYFSGEDLSPDPGSFNYYGAVLGSRNADDLSWAPIAVKGSSVSLNTPDGSSLALYPGADAPINIFANGFGQINLVSGTRVTMGVSNGRNFTFESIDLDPDGSRYWISYIGGVDLSDPDNPMTGPIGIGGTATLISNEAGGYIFLDQGSNGDITAKPGGTGRTVLYNVLTQGYFQLPTYDSNALPGSGTGGQMIAISDHDCRPAFWDTGNGGRWCYVYNNTPV